ncbi:hypothetical protein VCHENC02_5563B, partial [Vibrio harveyi]
AKNWNSRLKPFNPNESKKKRAIMALFFLVAMSSLQFELLGR